MIVAYDEHNDDDDRIKCGAAISIHVLKQYYTVKKKALLNNRVATYENFKFHFNLFYS